MSTTDYTLSNFIQQSLKVPVFAYSTGPKPTFPCVVYSKQGGTGTMTHTGPSYKVSTYTYSSKAKTLNQARFIGEQIYALLQGYNGEIFAVNGSSIEDYDEGDELYFVDQDYEVLEGASLPYFRPVTGMGTSGSLAIWYDEFKVTGSDAVKVSGSDVVIQGNLTVQGTTNIILSSSFMTAGFAEHAATASYLQGSIDSASYATFASTANLASTASFLIGSIASASYAVTAAYALNTPTLPAGLVSSSVQVLGGSGVYSSSAQIGVVESASYAANSTTASYALNSPTLPAGLVSSSAQVLNGTGIYSSSAQLPAGIVSSSAQVLIGSTVYSSSAQLPAGLVSGSYIPTASIAGTAYSAAIAVTSSYAINSMFARTASFFALPAGIISSSAQLPAGLVSGSTIPTASYVSVAQTASYFALPAGIVSSSAQVLVGSTVFSSSAQLPAGLVSGSTQIETWTTLSSSYALTASHCTDVPATSSWSMNAVSASYAPASPSASYALTASVATSVSGYAIWVGTSAAYAAINPYDANTLYFVKA